MNILIAGAGPAGLYLAYLLKRQDARHQIRIVEQNPPDSTFGFGVVFSDRALDFLRDDDEETHALIVPAMQRWTDLSLVHRGQRITIDGVGFAAIGRLRLLQLLQQRLASVGVEPQYCQTLGDAAALAGHDLVVAADGANSFVRRMHEAAFGTVIEPLANRFVWYGTTQPFDTLTQTFVATGYGCMNAHHYPYAPGMSTFIIECDPATWQRAGFEHMDEDATRKRLEQAFAETLGGRPLIANKSIWRQFPKIRNAHWSAGHCVLVGDALRTAHFSIGSGTRLAFEDVIALAKALREHCRRRAGRAAGLRGRAPAGGGQAGGRRQPQRRLVRTFRRAHAAASPGRWPGATSSAAAASTSTSCARCRRASWPATRPGRPIIGDESRARSTPTDSFASLPLPPATLHNLQRLGYDTMTPIQAASLPLALAGHDLIAQAKTGSGKTAAFGLALLANLNPRRFAVQSLVLCPTRELADQVTQELRRLARAEDHIKILTLCGGATMRPQLASLEHGAHIVVGTPGRIMDHLERGSLDLQALNTLVLDEADRMLDMGFHDDIATVAKQCPAQRQTLLFSATYPDGIAKLSAAFMRQPKEVKLLQSACRSQDPPALLRSGRGAAPACGGPAAQPLPADQHAGLLQHQAALPRAGAGAARHGLRRTGTARRPGAA